MTTTPAWYQAYTRLGRLFGFTVAPYGQVRRGPGGPPSAKTVEAQLRALGCSDKECGRVLAAASTIAASTSVSATDLLEVAVDAISVGIQPNTEIERHLAVVTDLTLMQAAHTPARWVAEELHPAIASDRVPPRVLTFLGGRGVDLHALAGFFGTDREGMFILAVRGEASATILMMGLYRLLIDPEGGR